MVRLDCNISQRPGHSRMRRAHRTQLAGKRNMNPTPADLNALRGMIRAWYQERDPERFGRLDPWLARCADDLARQLIVFRLLAPGVWQIGAEPAPVYRDAPRALEAAHVAIRGVPGASAAEFVARKASHPDNALRNALLRSLPWVEQRCAPLAYALRFVGVRRSGALFYDPPRDAPRIVTA
jgi:hypothetical protein